MKAIELDKNQITRRGIYLIPNLSGHTSLFFNPLTWGRNAATYEEWENELNEICEDNDITYYYFEDDKGTRIYVYSNDLIVDWRNNKYQ